MSRALEAQVAETGEVINAAHGRLVEVVAAVIADPGAALGPGVHTPASWLAWKARSSRSRAGDIERLAHRAGELPCTVTALVEGMITLDQAAVIARHVPARFEAAACDPKSPGEPEQPWTRAPQAPVPGSPPSVRPHRSDPSRPTRPRLNRPGVIAQPSAPPSIGSVHARWKAPRLGRRKSTRSAGQPGQLVKPASSSAGQLEPALQLS